MSKIFVSVLYESRKYVLNRCVSSGQIVPQLNDILISLSFPRYCVGANDVIWLDCKITHCKFRYEGVALYFYEIYGRYISMQVINIDVAKIDITVHLSISDQKCFCIAKVGGINFTIFLSKIVGATCPYSGKGL